MGRLLTLMILMLGAFGCGKLSKVDEYEKSRECAAQAALVMKKESDWSNHYSRKYDKCYIEETTAPGTFPIYVHLVDAFERVNLVEWRPGEHASAKVCGIRGADPAVPLGWGWVTCDKARAFIDCNVSHCFRPTVSRSFPGGFLESCG